MPEQFKRKLELEEDLDPEARELLINQMPAKSIFREFQSQSRRALVD
jgi:hypothetical protein